MDTRFHSKQSHRLFEPFRIVPFRSLSETLVTCTRCTRLDPFTSSVTERDSFTSLVTYSFLIRPDVESIKQQLQFFSLFLLSFPFPFRCVAFGNYSMRNLRGEEEEEEEEEEENKKTNKWIRAGQRDAEFLFKLRIP